MTLISRIIKRVKISQLKFFSKGKNLRIIDFPIYILNPNVCIGNNVTIYPNVMFFGEGKIIIEDNVKIGNNVVIYASKGSYIHVKKLSSIAANSYLIDCNHGIAVGVPIQSQELDSRPVEIGPDVWVGAGCIIGKGSIIGEGAVIGANSFVNKNVEPYTIVGGSPAKFIRKRK